MPASNFCGGCIAWLKAMTLRGIGIIMPRFLDTGPGIRGCQPWDIDINRVTGNDSWLETPIDDPNDPLGEAPFNPAKWCIFSVKNAHNLAGLWVVHGTPSGPGHIKGQALDLRPLKQKFVS